MNKKITWTKWMAASALLVLVGCHNSNAQNNSAFGASSPPVLDSKPSLSDFRYAIANMVEKVQPVVVSIQTETKVAVNNQLIDPFEFFFGGRMPQQQQRETPKQQGLGSGVIVSDQGYILTNNHVVEKADQITVTLADKRTFDAEIVGTDPQTDVAVIKLKKKVENLPVAFLGKSENLRVGEWIVAIGNPYGLSHTVTTGIVSAKGVHNRGITSYENFIQTDAAINPGNSGGAMFDLDGKLVGINTAILSQSGGFQGIGFAIPIDLAKSVMEDLIKYGKVSRGWLGVSIQDLNPELAKAMKSKNNSGALINEVFEDSPAKKSGVQSGDVVIAVDGHEIKDANELRHTVAMLRPGTKSTFTVLRNGKSLDLTIIVASREDSDQLSGNPANGGNAKGLGLEVSPLTDEQRQASGVTKEEGGVIVSNLKENSPAEQAGLQKGDIILKINGRDIKGISSFKEALAAESKAEALLVLIKRDRGRMFIAIGQ